VRHQKGDAIKICDRCHDLDGSAVMATEEVVFDRLGEVHDVCESCKEKLRDFIVNPSEHDKRGHGPRRTGKTTVKAKKKGTRSIPSSDGDDKSDN
jgi:hypothetical protein